MVKHEPMPISIEEKNKILAQAKEHNDFDYMLFLTLAKTGRRIGELYGLQDGKKIGRVILDEKRAISIDGKKVLIDRTRPIYKKFNTWKYGVKVNDIDFKKNTMKVWVFKRRKFEQDETVLHPELAAVIKSYIIRNQLRSEDYVYRKKGRAYRNLNNVFRKYAKLAGVPLSKTSETGHIKSLSIHTLRHLIITELKRQGWSNERIMIFTGHKTANVLNVYSHIVPLDLKDEFISAVNEI